MLTSGFAYLAFLTCFAGVVSTLERKYKDTLFFKYVPTPVLLYLLCMIFATFDLWQNTPEIKETYKTVKGHIIPAMIFVMLLRCDIRKIIKLGPRMLLGFFSATITIMIGFIVMFAMMKGGFGPGRPSRKLDRRDGQHGGSPRSSGHFRLVDGLHAAGR